MSVAIPTAMTERELVCLEQLAGGRYVLELGSWYGASTVAMAKTAARVVAVDWHYGDDASGHEDTLAGLRANLREHGLTEKVVLVVGRFEAALPMLDAQRYDLVFIDGDHSAEGVRYEARWAMRLLYRSKESVIAFHDYGRPEFAVTEFVDGIWAARPSRPAGSKEVIDTLCFWRPFE